MSQDPSGAGYSQYSPHPQYAPYPPYPRPPGGVDQRDGRPPDKTMANWALGLSLVPCGISLLVALVLAIIVLVHRDDGLDHGKRRAVGALCVIGGWVVLAVVVFAVSTAGRADRDDSGRITAAGDSPVVDLEVGDCIAEDVSTGVLFTVAVLPCSEPHRAEVFATFDLEGEWTSVRKVSRVAENGCAQRFEPYVGRPLRRSDLDVLYFQPQDEASFRYDPGVVCIGVSPGPVTESFQGSGARAGSGPATTV